MDKTFVHYSPTEDAWGIEQSAWRASFHRHIFFLSVIPQEFTIIAFTIKDVRRVDQVCPMQN